MMRSVLLTIVFKFIFLGLTFGCIELLNNQWTQMSVEERVERAEIVLVIKIVKKLKPFPKSLRFYSAKCQIIDVLKGWQSFNKTPDEQEGWNNQKTIIINGFGSTIDCLSDVVVNEFYIFFGMFKVDSNLWASYFRSFGAVENFSPDVYERTLTALGLYNWNPWSTCSKKCDVGLQQRRRNCILIKDCDYSWTVQFRQCNWQSCNNFILSNVDFADKEVNDIKNTPISLGRNIYISISLHNLTVQSYKSNEIFMFQLIDDEDIAFRFSVTSDATVQIKSVAGNKVIKFPIEKLFSMKNEENFINIFINDSGIAVESLCHIEYLRTYRDRARKFFSSQTQKVISKLSKQVYVKISADSVEYYKNIVCKEHIYNHSSALAIAEKSQILNYKLGNSISTQSPKFQWSKCSVTCGVGWQKRIRPCLDEECSDPDQNNIKSEIRTCVLTEKCPEESCKRPCQNDGQCIKWKCYCPNGYQGQYCQHPVCKEKCKNNGICIAPNVCQCSEGYEGNTCEKIQCNVKCLNGGQCLKPNVCTCSFGYTGKQCEKKECSPPCQNNGTCQSENICSCPDGVTGSRCEKYECYPQCMNGGICIEKNKCQCPTDFSGSFCETHICNRCFNGGKCIGNMCQCPVGYYGTECQSKICVTGLKFKKIIKPVIIQFPVIVSNKMCIDSICTFIQPQRSVIVNKVIFKPYIDCL